jgi:hypothetical protein
VVPVAEGGHRPSSMMSAWSRRSGDTLSRSSGLERKLGEEKRKKKFRDVVVARAEAGGPCDVLDRVLVRGTLHVWLRRAV